MSALIILIVSYFFLPLLDAGDVRFFRVVLHLAQVERFKQIMWEQVFASRVLRVKKLKCLPNIIKFYTYHFTTFNKKFS